MLLYLKPKMEEENFMKKYIISLISFLIIISASNTQAGDYVRTKIIEASWGNLDDQFGLVLEAEGNCPQSMTVDDRGNLAILDLVNNRVQLYSSTGKWMGKFTVYCRAFDIKFMKDHITVLAPYDYLIEQYNPQGELIKRIPINKRIDLMDGLRIIGDQICVQTAEQMQYNIKQQSLKKQLETQQLGFSGSQLDRKFQTRWIDPHKGYLIINDTKTGKRRTVTITTKEKLVSVVFLDTDGNGNIYIRKELFDDTGDCYFEVDKFNINSEVVNTIRIKNENIVAPFKPITVNSKGNVYYLEIKSEGFSVISWQQQN